MKIVILDGYVANPGDLSWEDFQQLGELTVHDRTPHHLVAERAADADAVIVNKVVLDCPTLQKLPKLKYIGLLATGYNNVDIHQAHRQGITVCNVPSYSTESVAQSIFAHILNITNHVALYADSVRRGSWQHCRDFSYRLTPIIELNGLTLGIYGLGHIGMRVAEIAHAFGMKIIARTSKSAASLPKWIARVSEQGLFRLSDVLVLCAPLASDNRHFVNADTLALMKPSAFLVNTSRGGLVDSAALANALNHGHLAAAGVDVLETEPPTQSEPLISTHNCFLTPHISWESDVARRRLLSVAAENLRAFVADRPQNVVS